MEYRFSKHADLVSESYIMKLIDVANEPGMISFATGLPDKRLFDIEGIKEATQFVLDSDAAEDSLQYGTTAGLPSLRKKIAERSRKELGLKCTWENVFITNGSQECFDHLGRMFLDYGDGMMVENPGYLGAIQSFSTYGPKWYGIDLDENGPNLDEIAKALKENPKLFYSIPSYQNPSGMSYSADSKKAVAELFEGSNTMIMEDDAYGELGYDGRIGKSMSSMTQNSILTGSFSKVISPGMRVGWMIVPDGMKKKASTSIEAACLHSGSFVQRILDRFLDTHDYDAYLKVRRKEYRRKKELFVDLLEDDLPDCMNWNDPKGGMFVWLKSPEGTESMRLFDECVKNKLVIMPGKPFHIRGGDNTIRLNFATASDEEIKKGMKILGKACRDIYV